MNDFGIGYAIGQNDGKNNGGGGFGDMCGGGWLWIIVLFALMFGGFGFGGLGGFGGCGGMGGAGLQGMATRADITAGFQFQELQNAVRGIERGITDATYALNNTVVNGFHGVERSVCDLSRQISECCCDNRAALADLKYAAAQENCDTRNLIQNTARDIIDNQNANARDLKDFLVQEKMAQKDARIAQLESQNMFNEQTSMFRAMLDASRAEILRRTGYEYPTPSYLVQPPTPLNFPTNGCGQVQFGGNGWGNCGNPCPCN